MKTRLIVTLILLSSVAAAQQYTESVLYSFSSVADGEYPVGGLVLDAKGNLYGTTQYGGSLAGQCAQGGCGTVFKLDATGKKTLLHQFTAGTDGALPNAALAIDKGGNLYGTTVFGGIGYGTVFKITAAGKYSILHSFGRTASDGKWPLGPVTLDAAGNLYGTTSDLNICASECPGVKDAGFGVVWKLSAKGAETILYAFGDNGNPVANVIRDGQGNIYGSSFAGTSTATAFYGGALFKVPAKGQESSLYTFCADSGCMDGVNPSYIARDSKGNFYVQVANVGLSAAGAIAKVTPQGQETILYQFCLQTPCLDGQVITGPLLLQGGTIYGTTNSGGAYGDGVVYQITSSGIETVLFSFDLVNGGAYSPLGGVIADASGNLYGTALGGATNNGCIFKLTKVSQ